MAESFLETFTTGGRYLVVAEGDLPRAYYEAIQEIIRLEEELENHQRAIAEIVSAGGGEVRVPHVMRLRPNDFTLSVLEDIATVATVYRVEWNK